MSREMIAELPRLRQEPRQGTATDRAAAELDQLTGEDYLQTLVRQLSACYHGAAVWLCLPVKNAVHDTLQVVAAWDRSGAEFPLRFSAFASPVTEVHAHGSHILPRGLGHAYPASVMARSGFDGCAGLTIDDHTGERLGTLLLLTRPGQSLPADPAAVRRLLPQRLAAELRREGYLRELNERLVFLEGMLEAIPNPIFFKDTHFTYRWCNRAMEQVLGIPRQELIGKSVLDVQPKSTAEINLHADLAALSEGMRIYENSFITGDGSCLEVILSKAVLPGADGSVRGLVCTFQDISAQKRAEREVFRLSNYDDITGLPNRFNFLRLLADLLRDGAETTVTVLDLDNFKILYDTLGHDFCSLLLTEASRRLLVSVGNKGHLARIDKERFAIVWRGPNDQARAEELGAELVATLCRPFDIGGQTVHATACVGIAVADHPQDGADHLLHCAELALHQAKQLGRATFMLYHGGLTEEAHQRLKLESDLRLALKNREMSLVYQPQIELESGTMTGVEALLRWHHPRKGEIPPDVFIPLAEETGLIHDLGLWVLETVCRQHVAWRAEGLAPIRMAVNVSGSQLKHPDFLDRLAATLRHYDMPADGLEIELTESTVMENSEQNIRILDQIKQLGLRLSIDDFGTGYSSLAYLKRFPIDLLKIDRAFVRDLPNNEDDVSIIEAIMLMARGLGLEVLAEGVETREQIEFLKHRGGNLAQGYYFSRPVDSDTLAALLRDGILATPPA